ncbi:hypothetical protein TNCV_4779481 [Trichonephila clavipes]|nr:hypothetical protein TNCV_4779481 [Trichonephila clavipes]
MYHNEIPERCKLNFTGIVDDALRIAGELFPKQTLKKYIRKEVEIDTDGRVRSRRFEKKRKAAERSLMADVGIDPLSSSSCSEGDTFHCVSWCSSFKISSSSSVVSSTSCPIMSSSMPSSCSPPIPDL